MQDVKVHTPEWHAEIETETPILLLFSLHAPDMLIMTPQGQKSTQTCSCTHTLTLCCRRLLFYLLLVLFHQLASPRLRPVIPPVHLVLTELEG